MGNKSSLNSIDPAQISNLPRKGMMTKCKIVNIHDGDTVTIVYMIGKGVPFKINLRLEGIDAPELGSKNNLEKRCAKTVSKWLASKLSRQRYWWVIPKKWDKYGGRIIGALYAHPDPLSESVCDEMINRGLVVPYNGGKKEAWTSSILKNILDTTYSPEDTDSF